MKTKYPLILLEKIHEVELHYKRPVFNQMKIVSDVEDAIEVLQNCFHPLKMDLQECFYVLYLTPANRLLGIAKVAEGSTIGVVLNTKAIFQVGLLLNASAMILAHNHPSGSLTPSPEDISITRKILELSKLMEIKLLDHLILTCESYVSFRQEGLL